MAKTYVWDEGYRRIKVDGGTSSDPITFRNITDYFTANPMPLNYNFPRIYGGRVTITGDTTTYSPTAGDKIAVTINGVLYDNIAISSASSITTVVTLINTATAAAKAISGYDVASKNVGGNLVLTARPDDESGDITIADGSGTSVTCVAKLFNTATRTLTMANAPYELTENNASNWLGDGGMGTPSDDTSAGNFTKGVASVTAAVSSVPTGTAITRVNSGVQTHTVYMTDTSAFAKGDEVMVVGSTNFNGMIFKITTITTNTSVVGQTPEGFPASTNEISIVGGTLIQPLQLKWNTAYSVTNSIIGGASEANKFKFSAKSDGASSPKIIAVICRNNTTTDANSGILAGLGFYNKEDRALTSSWQDFEVDIRTETVRANALAKGDSYTRGEYRQFSKVYILFDGLSVGENVWIDGVRFCCSNRNPTETSYNNYVFPSGLTVPSGCWFKDYGFKVRWDCLDAWRKGSYSLFDFTAANVGEIQLGDYSGLQADGGVFVINDFCVEDTGGVTFLKCQLQGMTIIGSKDTYGWGVLGGSDNVFRNCNFIDCLNIFSTQANSTFESGAWMGGRYFAAFPNNMTINGIYVYGVGGYAFWSSGNTTPLAIKNVKIITPTKGTWSMWGSRSYEATAAKIYGLRMVNFDLSEAGTNPRLQLQNYAIHIPYTKTDYVAFSFNLTVTDDAGTAISGATVRMLDRNGTQLFSVTTSATGVITEQIVDTMSAYVANTGGDTTTYFSFDTPTTTWSYFFPFTLTVSKSGYETYTDILLKDGYSRTNEICKKGYSGKIALKRSRISIDQEARI